MKAVDLHIHSFKSDGSLSPTELVDEALRIGLRAFALTDHDTVEGIDEALTYSADKDIEVIPGIELSTEYQGKDIHIVGLYINHNDEEFQKALKTFRDSRDLRNEKMCKMLADEAGMDISYQALMDEDPGAVITRAHYARYMLKKGYTKSLKEAFDRYIGDHCKYFIPREKITPEDGIKLILKAGGIPVLAHPVLYGMGKDRLDTLVTSLKENGLKALEAVYSTYTLSDEHEMKALAKKHGLKISGGSDFHGAAKPGLYMGKGYGKLFVPESILDELINE